MAEPGAALKEQIGTARRRVRWLNAGFDAIILQRAAVHVGYHETATEPPDVSARVARHDHDRSGVLMSESPVGVIAPQIRKLAPPQSWRPSAVSNCADVSMATNPRLLHGFHHEIITDSFVCDSHPSHAMLSQR